MAKSIEDLSDTIADNLRYWRTVKDLTQKELSDRSGVSPRTIAMIERGYVGGNYHAPSIATLLDIANTLYIEVDELLFSEPSAVRKAS